MKYINVIIILFNLLLPIIGNTFTVEETLPTPQQESHAKILFAEVRCLVCAGQSLADSDVLLAQNMRALIRKMIRDGKTDSEIRAYLVSRYGKQVLLRPPFEINTYFLWFGPALIFILGLVGIFFVLRR